MNPMSKGEPAIVIDDFAVFHPECYREASQEALKSVGVLNDEWLANSSIRITAFDEAANQNSAKNLQTFYDSWGKLTLVPQLLKTVVSDARRMGVIGLIHEYKLKRRLNNIYRTTLDIAEEYRDGFAEISAQVKIREMYPIIEYPTPKVDPLSKLREEEKLALENIVDSMKSMSGEIKPLLQEVKDISRKLKIAERREIQRQIDRIDKEARPLP